MNKISFSPNSITKKLLSSLDTRPKKVLEERFGLVSLEPRTLESIGQEYGITRERVRQIEAFAINKIKNSEAFKQISDVFNGLQEGIDSKGGLVQEDDFLSFLSKKRQDQRHFFFLLVVGEPFTRLKEDEHFHHSWAVDTNYASGIRDALKKVHNEITDDRLFTEKEVISVFGGDPQHLKKASIVPFLKMKGVTPRPQKGGLVVDKIAKIGFTSLKWRRLFRKFSAEWPIRRLCTTNL